MADITHDTPAGAARPAAAIPSETWSSDGWFYLTMASVAAALLLLGFAPSFYLKSVIHAPPPLSLLTLTHGVVFTAWMAVFLTQSALIAVKRPAPHRQLGILGVLLFGAMVTLGFSTAITAGRLGHVPPGAPEPLAFMALPLITLTAVLVLVAAAVWNRRRSDWHKRLMLTSFFLLTGPGTDRILITLGVGWGPGHPAMIVTELLLAAAMVYDYRAHRRVHPAYWVGAAMVAVTHLGFSWAFGSPAAWMGFGRAITQA
jgi:hypothetical protein